MDVVLDGEKGGVAVPEGASYRSIFQLVLKTALSRKRIVLSISLDGEPLSPERQKALGEQVPPSSARLEITTQDSTQMAVETLENLIKLVPAIEKIHDKGGEQVVAGNYKDAMMSFEECFVGWQAITAPVADIARLVSLDLRSVKVGNGSAHARADKVGEALEKFKTAFTQKDVVRIGDIVQYELRPLLGEWGEALEALGKHLADGPGTAR